jgi:ferredoxin
MAKIIVDEALCTGCGICSASCANVFEIGDDNKAHVKSEGPCDCDLKQIASECPVEAIKVE